MPALFRTVIYQSVSDEAVLTLWLRLANKSAQKTCVIGTVGR